MNAVVRLVIIVTALTVVVITVVKTTQVVVRKVREYRRGKAEMVVHEELVPIVHEEEPVITEHFTREQHERFLAWRATQSEA